MKSDEVIRPYFRFFGVHFTGVFQNQIYYGSKEAEVIASVPLRKAMISLPGGKQHGAVVSLEHLGLIHRTPETARLDSSVRSR